MIRCNEKPFGFEYGAATVERAASNAKEGWVIMMLTTQKTTLQIYVTKTGKVRVYDYHKNVELLPGIKAIT
jgi:hypothetical protein